MDIKKYKDEIEISFSKMQQSEIHDSSSQL